MNSAGIGAGLDAIGNNLQKLGDFYLKNKGLNQNQKQFDALFDQNKEQFGLQFALKEFATRKGLELEETQMLYNQDIGRQNLKLNQATTREGIKSSSQQRFQQAEQFNWAREDRDKLAKQDKAFSKGLFKGLLGGK
ncbi:MAG: hypothetical protein GY861_12460 [bacterium]|nr:hypothetical protein [bacterium]